LARKALRTLARNRNKLPCTFSCRRNGFRRTRQIRCLLPFIYSPAVLTAYLLASQKTQKPEKKTFSVSKKLLFLFPNLLALEQGFSLTEKL
jgi:hypothetical protein